MPVSRFGIISFYANRRIWLDSREVDLENGAATLRGILQRLNHKNSALPTMSHVMILYYSSCMIKNISYIFLFCFCDVLNNIGSVTKGKFIRRKVHVLNYTVHMQFTVMMLLFVAQALQV